MEVTLIQHPVFRVDFSKFSLKTEKEVETLAQKIIRFVGVLIHSAMEGALQTLQHTYSSFVRLVIDTLKITDFYFGAFKIGYWAFTQGFTFVATTGRLIMKAYSPPKENYLSQFLGEGINPGHIQVKETKLDASNVPSDVQVKSLLTYFDKIDFRDVDSPRYMKEENPTKLRKRLEAFVENVEGRVARVGTPPAMDTVRLENFYQQIEEAVRLALQKTNDKIQNFLVANPTAETSDDPNIKKQYRNLLEDRSRFVIDLAIAGEFCGARYMAEAMEGYFHICGEGELTGTLEQIIFQILAEKRLKIAKAQIERHYGTDAHVFSKYMQNMGKLLAIPGTENIIEHLSQSFDVELAMTRFFKEYDEACIIETIQEKLRASAIFRGQVTDWFKNNREGWAPVGSKSSQVYIAEIQRVINEEMRLSEELTKKLGVIDQILAIPDATQDYPSPTLPWEEFVQELFTLPDVKTIVDTAYPVQNKDPMRAMREKMGYRSDVSGFLIYGASGELFKKKYQDKDLQNLTEQERVMVEKVKAIRQILAIDETVILRILKGESKLQEVVEGCCSADHDVPFLQALNMMSLHEQGLRPLHMEWFLDAHHVFYPRFAIPKGQPVGVGIEKKTSFKEVVDPDGFAFQFQQADQDDFQAVYQAFAIEMDSDSIRYQFGAETDKDRLTHHIFEKAFKERSEEVIVAAHAASPKTIYSSFRKVVYIDGAALGAKVSGNAFLKLALSIYIVYRLIKLGRAAYEQTSMWADRAHDYFMKESHPTIHQGYKMAIKTHVWIQNNKWRLAFFGYFLNWALNRIPHPFARSLAGRIDPFAILGGGGSYFGILWDLGKESVSLGWNMLSLTSSKLQSISNREAQERLALEKRYAFAVWHASLATD